MTRERVARMICYVAIAISALLLLATPFISAAIVVAALVGAVGAILVFALGPSRLAWVVAGFSIIPLVGLVLVEAVYSPASNGYLVFAPMAAVAALVLFSGRLRQPLR